MALHLEGLCRHQLQHRLQRYTFSSKFLWLALICNTHFFLRYHYICSPRSRTLFWDIMMTSSDGNISALLAICAGNSPVPGEFPTQRPVTRSFDVFLDLRLNKRLSKQPWDWWFESLSRPLWRHRNDCPRCGSLHSATYCSVHCIEIKGSVNWLEPVTSETTACIVVPGCMHMSPWKRCCCKL